MRIGTPGFIPARLTEARDARRVTTKSALARRLGVSPTSVSRWEDEGADQSPDYATLIRLADDGRDQPLRHADGNGVPHLRITGNP